GQSRPIYVNTDAPPSPVVSIGQHERRVLDLYYALPSEARTEAELGGFTLLWQVTTPARVFASRSEFQRFEREPPDTYERVILDPGWGPFWWFDPFWGRRGFGHHGPIIVVRPGGVHITRPPHWHYHPTHPHGR